MKELLLILAIGALAALLACGDDGDIVETRDCADLAREAGPCPDGQMHLYATNSSEIDCDGDGSCVEYSASCTIYCEVQAECEPGDAECLDGSTYRTCEPSKKWGAVKTCPSPQVCRAGACEADACFNQTRDVGETDVDCGGSCVAKCPLGKTCSNPQDCETNFCDETYMSNQPRVDRA